MAWFEGQRASKELSVHALIHVLVLFEAYLLGHVDSRSLNRPHAGSIDSCFPILF